MTTTTTDHYLLALVRQVARADRRAFAVLHETLAPTIAEQFHAAIPDPAEAAALTAATFVEVWWLARFHTAEVTDVPAWIVAIAARRARERHPGPLQDVHDRRSVLALTALLH